MDKQFLLYMLRKFAFEFVNHFDLRLEKTPRIVLPDNPVLGRFLFIEFNGATCNDMQIDKWFDRYIRPELCYAFELMSKQIRGCDLIGFHKLPVPFNLDGGTIELEGFSARILNMIAQNYDKVIQIHIQYTPLWVF